MNTKDIEEIVEEFDRKFPLPKILALSGGKGVERDAMKNYLRNTLTTLTQHHKADVEKAVEEVVVCAAVMAEDGSIYRGHRHGHAMQACRDEGKSLHKGVEQQGFITTHNRYVLREEARRLQDAAGIPSADKEGYRGSTLFSEDLYSPQKDVVLQAPTKTDKQPDITSDK